ncbi:MAG: polymer-forming cytoskeletal protein [bacterium]|nr:polymer-forming cytoskeletal protein [bacterium]
MSKHTDHLRHDRHDRHDRHGLRAAAVVAVLLILAAAPSGAALFGVDDREAEALCEELGQRYKVLVLSEGYVLTPAEDDEVFEVIEVRDHEVFVDGEPTNRADLRELLDDDGELIFALAGERVDHDAVAAAAEQAEERAREIEDRIRDQAEELEQLHREQQEELEEIDQRESRRERRHRGMVRTDTRVSFGSSLTIDEDESSRDVVVLGGSLDVQGEVRGTAVVVGGGIDITGEVDGDVTAVGGPVSLGSEARVDGDVVSVGDSVHRDPGAWVRGEILEISVAPFFGVDGLPWGDFGWDHDWDHDWDEGWFEFSWGNMWDRLTGAVLLVLLMLLILLVARRLVPAIADRVVREPWKAGLVGILAQILFLPILFVVFVVLAISLVGIPLLVLLVPITVLAAVLISLLGFAGVGLAAGRKLEAVFGSYEVSAFVAMGVGVSLILVWSILGEALSCLAWPIKMVAVMLLVLGALIKYLAVTVGMGSVLLHKFSPLPAAAGPGAAMPPPPQH